MIVGFGVYGLLMRLLLCFCRLFIWLLLLLFFFLFLIFIICAFLCFGCIRQRLSTVGPSSPEGAQLKVRAGGFLL
jgi:hypothetical protein